MGAEVLVGKEVIGLTRDLIQAGQYNENQKNVRINKISKLLSCPKERTTKILYYMEKEKI